MEMIKKVLDKAIELLCIFTMIVMTILVSWQVFTRYVFNKPSAITEQLSQYLFVWLVMYGAAYVFGKRDHMKISFIKEQLPKKVEVILDVFQEMVTLIFAMGIMTYGGYLSSLRQMSQLDAALQIPIGVVYSAIPISSIFIIFYSIYNCIKILKDNKNKVKLGEK